MVTQTVVNRGKSSSEEHHNPGICGLQRSPVLLGRGPLSGVKRKFSNCQLPPCQVGITVFPQRFCCGCPWSLKGWGGPHSAPFRDWERRSSNTACDKTAAWILDHALVAVNSRSMEIKLPTSPTCSRLSKLHDLRSFNSRNIFTWISTQKELYILSTDLVSFSVCGLQDLASFSSPSAPSTPSRVHSPHLVPSCGQEAQTQNAKHTAGLTLLPTTKLTYWENQSVTIWILYEECKPWTLGLALGSNTCLVLEIPWDSQDQVRSPLKDPGDGHPAVNTLVQRRSSLKCPSLLLRRCWEIFVGWNLPSGSSSNATDEWYLPSWVEELWPSR